VRQVGYLLKFSIPVTFFSDSVLKLLFFLKDKFLTSFLTGNNFWPHD